MGKISSSGFFWQVNRQFRVTITDPERAWFRHILDSLTLVPFIARHPCPPSGPLRVVDIGSGPGLPGLPIAIAMPDVDVTLNERRGKAAEWLAETSRALGLPNVDVVVGRVQDMDVPKYRGHFDVVVVRRLASLAELLQYTFPILRPGGRLIAMKGKKAEAELLEAQPTVHAQKWGTTAVHETFAGTENAATIVECVKCAEEAPPESTADAPSPQA